MAEARCMKCKKQVEIKDPVESVTKNNMRICKGVCPDCGTKVCRILGKAKEEENAKEAEEKKGDTDVKEDTTADQTKDIKKDMGEENGKDKTEDW